MLLPEPPTRASRLCVKGRVAVTVVQARQGEDLNFFPPSSHHLDLKHFRRPEFWVLHMPCSHSRTLGSTPAITSKGVGSA